MPSDDVLLMLIQSAVLALNQANATGNYSVLREMGAPGFQSANSAEQLAKIFAKLRDRNLDLSPVLLFPPKLYRKPEMSSSGMMRVMGFFPTSPERVNFDLIFQPVQQRWRLFGIAVHTKPEPSPTTAGDPAPAAPTDTSAPESKDGAKTDTGSSKPAAEASRPPAPAKKPKPKAAASETPALDVRDRIDSPPPAPAAAAKPENVAKPEKKGIWNPFGR
jgi:hypothetical protein